MEENEPEAFSGAASYDEIDNVFIQSEFSDQLLSDSAASEFEMEDDATADARTLESRARGRPTNKLRVNNGYVWSRNVPRKRLGTLRSFCTSSVTPPPPPPVNNQRF